MDAVYAVFWNYECIIFTSMMSMIGMTLNPTESQIAQESSGVSDVEKSIWNIRVGEKVRGHE